MKGNERKLRKEISEREKAKRIYLYFVSATYMMDIYHLRSTCLIRMLHAY